MTELNPRPDQLDVAERTLRRSENRFDASRAPAGRKALRVGGAIAGLSGLALLAGVLLRKRIL